MAPPRLFKTVGNGGMMALPPSLTTLSIVCELYTLGYYGCGQCGTLPQISHEDVLVQVRIYEIMDMDANHIYFFLVYLCECLCVIFIFVLQHKVNKAMSKMNQEPRKMCTFGEEA